MRFRALVLTEEDLEELDDLHVHSFSHPLSKKVGVRANATEELKLWGLTLGMTL
jgi:hypothetical protein